MKNIPVLYLKLMDSVSENNRAKKKRRSESLQDWEERGVVGWVGYHTIIRFSLPLHLFILCYQYGDDQNSLFLTKRRSNEGLSISVDWLVNLGIMSVLKASGLATVFFKKADSFKHVFWKHIQRPLHLLRRALSFQVTHWPSCSFASFSLDLPFCW